MFCSDIQRERANNKIIFMLLKLFFLHEFRGNIAAYADTSFVRKLHFYKKEILFTHAKMRSIRGIIISLHTCEAIINDKYILSLHACEALTSVPYTHFKMQLT